MACLSAARYSSYMHELRPEPSFTVSAECRAAGRRRQRLHASLHAFTFKINLLYKTEYHLAPS